MKAWSSVCPAWIADRSWTVLTSRHTWLEPEASWCMEINPAPIPNCYKDGKRYPLYQGCGSWTRTNLQPCLWLCDLLMKSHAWCNSWMLYDHPIMAIPVWRFWIFNGWTSSRCLTRGRWCRHPSARVIHSGSKRQWWGWGWAWWWLLWCWSGSHMYGRREWCLRAWWWTPWFLLVYSGRIRVSWLFIIAVYTAIIFTAI